MTGQNHNRGEGAVQVQESAVDTITVLIIDDQPIFRAGLRHMLSSIHPGLEIVGEA